MMHQTSNLCRSRFFVATLLTSLLSVIAACAQPTTAPEDVVEFKRANTTFQRDLDANGIDLVLPSRGKVILVNVPAFELLAIENGREAFRSRIIVGTPWTPTPLIDTSVTSVRFRPTWRPTPSMIASGEYQDRVWPPGPENPLGLAAVRLEPPLLVYLHDTNRPALFAEKDRALSHGCIRVEQWEELVAWILSISNEEVRRRANGTRTRDDPAPEIPVLIRYYQRFPDQLNRVIQHPDIYDLAGRPTLSSASSCTLD